jgi:predicted ATPase
VSKIDGFRIKNFRALKEVRLGKLWSDQSGAPLTPLTAVIGPNGAGKSSLFDAFGFLADCMRLGIEEACDNKGRGGFARLRSQGQTGPIEFEIYYKEDGNARPITYEVAIDLDGSRRPQVVRERLRQRRQGQKHGQPFSFLMLQEGRGIVWKGQAAGVQEDQTKRGKQASLFELMNHLKQGGQGLSNVPEGSETEVVELDDARHLGISTLGSLKQHPRISAFRRFIEGWYLSYFTPDAARSLPLAGPQRHLNVHGDNLGNVVQFLEREHKDRFNAILKQIAAKIPGLQQIQTEESRDGRLLLSFNQQGFTDPFYAQQMSDGTLKVFAYLLLLADPNPPPFICIEEPENGLHHKLLESLAVEFRAHARNNRSQSQVFLTTHQPYLVDALNPEEVWVLRKGKDGFSTVARASEVMAIKELVAEGLPLGGLWYSEYLDER